MKKYNSQSTSIFIAGPPCSGKSEAGRILASMLELPFYDLDTVIESFAGMWISEIFRTAGEDRFRELESDCLERLLKKNERMILALGGGCLLQETNLLSVKERGILFTLAASTETLQRRRENQNGKRPLAFDDNALLRLLSVRKKHYDSLPNRIDTTHLTPVEIASRIAALIK
jgi:shikimate kinase